MCAAVGPAHSENTRLAHKLPLVPAGALVAYEDLTVAVLAERQCRVGRVVENLVDRKVMRVHKHLGVWVGIRVVWKPAYLNAEGVEVPMTDEVALLGKVVQEDKDYKQIAEVVELNIDGSMAYGPLRRLELKRWSLAVDKGGRLGVLSLFAPLPAYQPRRRRRRSPESWWRSRADGR